MCVFKSLLLASAGTHLPVSQCHFCPCGVLLDFPICPCHPSWLEIPIKSLSFPEGSWRLTQSQKEVWLSLGSMKNMGHSGFYLLSCKALFLAQDSKLAPWLEEGNGWWPGCHPHSSLEPLLFFSGTTALSQNLHLLQELSTHQDTSLFLRFLTWPRMHSRKNTV